MKSYVKKINSIKEASKQRQNQIHEAQWKTSDDLKRSGVHADVIKASWEKCHEAKSKVEAAASEKLLTFRLHKMLNFKPTSLFPLTVLDSEMVLVKINATDAFLVYNSCCYKVTTHKIWAGGLPFSFICGCENCNRHFKNGLKDKDECVRAIAQVCVQHGIKNVVMRHCNGWPNGLAIGLGIELREIGSEKYQELYDVYAERIKTWES